LGWSPSVTFEEGLIATVNAIREECNANS